MVSAYRRIPADPSRWFEPEDVRRARDYQRPLNMARAARLVLNTGLLVALVATRAASRIADAAGTDRSWPLSLLLVLAGLLVAFSIVDLPVAIWTTFVHDRRWGFSTQTPRGFVMDQLKGLAVGFGLLAPLLLAAWWLMRTTALWWVAAWALFFAFSVLLAILYPVVLAPIFNRFAPVPDPDLEARLRAMAESQGLRIKSVQSMDASKRTRKDNAYFAGLGRTKQIVLYDNLLEQPRNVVESVMAHEIGHWVRRHTPKLLVAGLVETFLAFFAVRLVAGWSAALRAAGVASLRNPASLPLVAGVFALVSMVTSLGGAWLSRAFEREADLFALELTRDYEGYVQTERNLSTRNLIDLAPSWWRYIRLSHPPPAERLELGRLWKKEQAARPS